VRQRNIKKLIVAIYVDDGLIAGSDRSEIDVFIDLLGRNFKITTAALSKFLGRQAE
jgi:hypothetical protein